MRHLNLLLWWILWCVPFATAAIYFEDCGSQGATVLEVDVAPCKSYPCTLVIGEQYTVRIGFTATIDVWSGMAIANSIYNGVTKSLRLKDPDLCDHLLPSCPVKTGKTYVFSYTGTVNWKIPDIKIYLQWQLANQYTWPFLCVQFPVQFTEKKANSANAQQH
ncbi:Niemann-Pick C2 protein [Clonorchis sinensis]|uniref:Niemann-Pick C2 protein n=1 Tax=Clonorchis sinensis TaxID=79923 RepID=G7Y2J7_CLOSI|nr:Niemann-Pick C2 protein [Clonorchis sinensis]